MRKTFVLPIDTRNAIVEQANDITVKLVDGGLDKEDAAEIVGLVVGEVLELALELVGVDDPTADALGEIAAARFKVVVATIAEGLRPDLDKVLAKAVQATKDGKPKRAKRLWRKAERIQARLA